MFLSLRIAAVILLCGIVEAAPDLAILTKAEQDLAARYRDTQDADDLWPWIEALAQLAWGCVDSDQHEEGAQIYRKALAQLPVDASLQEAEFVVLLHDGLGRALQNSGDFTGARRHLQKALDLSRVSKLSLANREGHLGLLELAEGHYREAGRLFYSALAHTPKSNVALLAHRYDCLGRYHLALRGHGKAKEYFAQALKLIQGEKELSQTLILDLRANVALCQFRNGKSEEALAIVEAIVKELSDRPEELPRLAAVLNLEATILNSLGETQRAEKRLQGALKILTEARGPSHPSLASLLANLGTFYFEDGRVMEAEKQLLKAKAILQKHIEGHHQSFVEVLYHLAACRLDKTSVKNAREAAGKLLDELVVSGGERELLEFRSQVDLHSLVCQLGDAELIAESLFHGKGRILEAILERKHLAGLTAGKQRALDRLLLNKESDPAEIQRLREEIDRAELSEIFPLASVPSWRQFVQILPAGVVFVDYVRYRTGTPETVRYGAVLLSRDAAPRWLPLAPEKRLNRLELLQRSLRSRAHLLRNPDGKAGIPMLPLLADLYRSFWQPIAEELPEETRQVIVCPEGRLHLMPFAVLRHREAERFLCEELPQLTIVDSGRRLMRKTVPGLDLSRPWCALGVADFFEHRTFLKKNDIPWSSALEQLDDLPSVRQELAELQKLAPEGSRFFLNREADQRALLNMEFSPAVLHLASHGFYHELASDKNLSAFYESGIVLGLHDRDDFLLFPDAVASLNLAGTRLVTLGTCRSASGRTVSGEGLLGLARGFTKAGAHNVLASLWELPDESTGHFMQTYYARLISGGVSPSALLWRMQREHFVGLRKASPIGAEMETSVLSYGGLTVTSSEPLK